MVYHDLPGKLDLPDDSFDIGLGSYFLLMYTALGYDFHIKAMDEMLRVCKVDFVDLRRLDEIIDI